MTFQRGDYTFMTGCGGINDLTFYNDVMCLTTVYSDLDF